MSIEVTSCTKCIFRCDDDFSGFTYCSLYDYLFIDSINVPIEDNLVHEKCPLKQDEVIIKLAK